SQPGAALLRLGGVIPRFPGPAGIGWRHRLAPPGRRALRSGGRAVASAGRGGALFVAPRSKKPGPSANTPRKRGAVRAPLHDQLRFTFRSRSRAISLSSQSRDNPPSRKTTWAVSVASEEAPRSEIETSAFFSAIESLIPSPTKQTVRPSFWSLST